MTKILVIEDEETVRENILELLDAEGFDAIAAENGRIGLARAQQHLPDLILCDIRMPELDGYGVLTALRSESKTAEIPFIFLSAKAAKTDLTVGMDLGANAYIIKPFTLMELLDTMEQVLLPSSLPIKEQVG
jgi:CheY-like chemotaxis protein